ncbi:MAG: DUF3570 domain-containing protein, partial [Thermodesulfobacteriota bacterium]
MAVINIRDKTAYFLYIIVSLMLLVNIFASWARAEDYVAAQGYVHTFNNNISSVYTGVFALNKDITLDTSAYFKFTLDSIAGQGDITSGASGMAASAGVDRSNIYRSNGDDDDDDDDGDDDEISIRNELTFGFTHNFNNIISIEVYYDYSNEDDYISSTPTVTLKKDLFQKNTTLTLGYSRNMDIVDGRFMPESSSRDT